MIKRNDEVISGLYYENWGDRASKDELDTIIKPIARETLKETLKFMGFYHHDWEVLPFKEKERSRIIRIIAMNICEKAREIKETSEQGKKRGFIWGVVFGIFLGIGIMVLLAYW